MASRLPFLRRLVTPSSGSFRCMSWWSAVAPAPRDPILGVTTAFLADQHPEKVNVGVGAYRDDSGSPVVLESVRQAENVIAGRELMEYLPMGGSAKFCEFSVKLAYGNTASVVEEKRVAAIQSLSGTGANRLFADFIKRFRPGADICVPILTWSNHHNIFNDAGVKRRDYRYYLPETRSLDFDGMKEDLKNVPNGSFVLLHACAHNPTGVDPSLEQWKQFSQLFKEKSLFPLFDMAYQGFASGDTEKDNAAVRIFLEDGHAIACAQSFAKNMGLYGQRIGCLSIVCESIEQAAAVKSQLEYIARPMYSNPPVHGALLVTAILENPDLKQLWHEEVKAMAGRIIGMRSALRRSLEELGSTLSWRHITDQIGMFCFSGLSPEQVDKLTKDYHIYMTRNGRISMAGVTSKNVKYLAKAIHEVTQ